MSRRVGQPKCGRAHTESRNSGRAESGPGSERVFAWARIESRHYKQGVSFRLKVKVFLLM